MNRPLFWKQLHGLLYFYSQSQLAFAVYRHDVFFAMRITILFFGALTEHTKTDRVLLKEDSTVFHNLASLRANIEHRYPGLIGQPYRTVINLEFANESDKVNDGDEIAFLPPYAGG